MGSGGRGGGGVEGVEGGGKGDWGWRGGVQGACRVKGKEVKWPPFW